MNIGVFVRLVFALGTLAASLPLANAQVEEVYIARSVRESRVKPTDFCRAEKTGFAPLYEGQCSFRSVATRPDDGRMTSANVKTIANAHACVGQKANPAIYTFYMLKHGRSEILNSLRVPRAGD